KAHLLAIWLLASRSDNCLPLDAEWVARRINATVPVDLKALCAAGFLEPHPASAALASRQQDACAEGEPEEEPEREPKQNPLSDPRKADADDDDGLDGDE